MARRRSTRDQQELTAHDVESILRGARAFYDAVCRINVKLDFKSKAYMDNGPILASLQTYCWMISGERDALNEPLPMRGKPTTVRIRGHKDKVSDQAGSFSVSTSRGVLNVIYDDCEIRRGISARYRRSEALELSKLIAAYLRDLEQLGELPVSVSSESEQSQKVRPRWQRGSGQ